MLLIDWCCSSLFLCVGFENGRTYVCVFMCDRLSILQLFSLMHFLVRFLFFVITIRTFSIHRVRIENCKTKYTNNIQKLTLQAWKKSCLICNAFGKRIHDESLVTTRKSELRCATSWWYSEEEDSGTKTNGHRKRTGKRARKRPSIKTEIKTKNNVLMGILSVYNKFGCIYITIAKRR